jgi:hypothetical protein
MIFVSGKTRQAQAGQTEANMANKTQATRKAQDIQALKASITPAADTKPEAFAIGVYVTVAGKTTLIPARDAGSTKGTHKFALDEANALVKSGDVRPVTLYVDKASKLVGGAGAKAHADTRPENKHGEVVSTKLENASADQLRAILKSLLAGK